jgi:hypothetical protein
MGDETVQGSRWLRRAARVALWLWAPSCLVLVACLMVAHWVTLPVPESHDPRLAKGLDGLHRGPGWLAVHVLYAECPCSQKLVRHLLDRGALPDVEETILLVGDDGSLAADAPARGYAVEVVTQVELARRFGVESAPLLAVVDPRGTVRYVGGYTPRKQGADVHDVEIVAALRRGDGAAELPLFGCAVSRELQAMLDPLNLKYARNAR